MKIGVITCHRAFNYGAVLQTYALQKYLETIGQEPEVIDYFPKDLYKSNEKKIIKKTIRNIIRTLDFKKGSKSFYGFLNRYMKMTKRYYTLDELEKNPPKDDTFIVGSDQVWNCNIRNGNDDTYFLSFVPKNKRKNSYAASIAMDSLTETQEKRFREKLNSFTAISVREESAVKLLKKAGIQKEIEMVVDPVFLLDNDEWKKMAEKSTIKIPKEKYVLIYAFKRQKEIYKYARKIANSNGYKVVSINTNIEDYFLDTDKYYWNIKPEDWLKLFLNAEEVITNSFHGLSFSIIFRKNFHQFMKNGKENSRMIDLLNELNLSNRIVKENEEILKEKTDFEETYKILNKEIENSKRFIEEKIING